MKSQRGSVLVVVLILMVAVSMIGLTILNQFDSTRTVTQSWLERRKVFYAAEGARSIAGVLIKNYMATNVNPTSADLVTYLNGSLPGMIPAPYAVAGITATVQPTVEDMPLPNGSYQGLSASVTNIDLKFTVTGPSASLNAHAVGQISMTLSLAQISLFQFTDFFDLDYVDWWPVDAWPNPATGMERVHANGILCMGGQNGASLNFATSGKNLFDAGNSACWRTHTFPTGNKTTVTNASGVATSFKLNGDSLCTNCLSTRTVWKDFAKSRWGGHVLDSVHGLQPLQFPGQSGEPMQWGIGFQAPANYNAVLSNDVSERFLIDPVEGGDSAQAKSEKFAYQADIRILDGVWYLKDPNNAANWPGVPVWSDHPGRYVDRFGKSVGQDDLVGLWGASQPHLFSFYEYNSAQNTLVSDTSGVISYGSLDVSGGTWMPGFWLDLSGLGDLNVCAFPTDYLQIPGHSGTAANCGGPNCELLPLTRPVHCHAGYPDMTVATKVLAAARSGFRDGHLQAADPTSANLLPINFNLGTFQTAMGTTTAGELGSYFGAGRFMGRGFNGVIYISGTWPGAESGYGSGLPSASPDQGAVADATQGGAFSTVTQQALPFPLCSNSPLATPAGEAGLPFDRTSQGGWTVNRFSIPDCSQYSASVTAFPNAVRIVNGATVDSAVFPKGLTIATNLPVFILGDLNTSSVTTSSVATPWVPVLIAGDQMAILSNGWSDAWSPWNVSTTLNSGSRVASATTVHAATMNGWAPNTNTDASENPGLNEDWSGVVLTMAGARALPFRPVYYQVPRADVNDGTFRRATNHFSFDPHLSLIGNQPPGTTFIEMSAITRWLQL